MELNVISRKYKIGKQISKGSFGIMRLGRNLKTNECVAIKLELKNAKEPTLHLEFRFYKLMGVSNCLPKLLYFGACGVYNALVLQLLGPNLRDCFELCGGTLPLKTVIQVAKQIIEIMEYIHSKRIIHRDLKPENFAIGRQDPINRLKLFDFGLAKEYIDVENNHIRMKTGKTIMGTARYISINCHNQYELSRRDDLESVGYILIYFVKGYLPWKQSNTDNNLLDKYTLIGNAKKDISVEHLCEGLPEEFLKYMKKVKTLEFEETPNYDQLKSYFTELFRQKQFAYDEVYEWTLVMQKKDLQLQKKMDTSFEADPLKQNQPHKEKE